MITNNYLMFVSKSNGSKESTNYVKGNERDNKGAFEEILNRKKDVKGYRFAYISKNSRANSSNQLNHSISEKQNKHSSITDRVKDINSSLENHKMDVNTKKTSVVENTAPNLEDDNEKKDLNKAYDYLTTLMLGATLSEKIQEFEGVTTELDGSQLSIESFSNFLEESLLMEGEVHQHIYEGLINSNENEDLLELVNLHNQSDETANKLEQIINEANLIEEEGLINSISNKLSDENIDKEITAVDPSANKYGNDKAQDLKQGSIVQTKANQDEKSVILINGHEEKDLVNSDDFMINDDVTIQNSYELGDQNFYTHFSENNFNFDGKNFENSLGYAQQYKSIIPNKEDIFEQIVEKVKFDMNNSDEIRIKLKPDFLGEISLKLISEKGIITAKAYVDNYNVKQLIESNLDTLKENMKGLGLNFEALDVSVGKDSGFDKNNGQAWKHSQRVKTKRLSIEKTNGSLMYDEDIRQLVGGLYSAEGNIDLIV